MKKISFLLLGFILVFSLASCGNVENASEKTNENLQDNNIIENNIDNQEDNAENKEIPQKPKISYSEKYKEILANVDNSKVGNIKLTDEIIKDFYGYFEKNFMQLSMLPDFSQLDKINHNDFTDYIVENAYLDSSVQKDRKDIYTSAHIEDFNKTANMLLGGFPAGFVNQDSENANFDGTYYIPFKIEVKYIDRYRITDLKVDKGIYTATIESYRFYKNDLRDYDSGVRDNDRTDNYQNVSNYAISKGENSKLIGINGYNGTQPNFSDYLEEMFLLDNYENLLSQNDKFKITFKLSGKTKYPLIYLSRETLS